MKEEKEQTVRLLLVEDDIESGEALREMIERRGIRTTCVPSAEEALRRFKPSDFDVVVADIRLRGMSGLDFLKSVRESSEDFPVILLTGYDSLSTAIAAVRLGAQDYIVKPLDTIEDLVTPVCKAVRAHRLVLQNRALQADLERRCEELRRLSERLTRTEEMERRRLSRELHDQVGQTLTALGINLSVVRGRISAGDADEAVRRLDETAAQVAAIGEQIRSVMTELRPAVLDDYGLSAALRCYVEQFSRQTSLTARGHIAEIEPRLPARTELALLRIVQEALTNAAKHAHGDSVAVTLERVDSEVRLLVEDTGTGFDAAKAEKERSGLGLVLMRERATAIGCEFRVESAVGAGTRVAVIVRGADHADQSAGG